MRLKIIALLLLTAAAVLFWRSTEKKVDFNTDIKPLLNKKCMKCHGGVKRSGEFSLLTRQDALGHTKSGKPAIVPGQPDNSELIRLITCADPEDRMPQKSDPLSESEINLFRRWIKQGAQWGDHWAYVPVKQPRIPGNNALWSFIGKKEPEWGHNDIDAYVLDRLKKEKLKPAPEADRYTLLRRVSLDLTGLPPDENLAAVFLQDTTAGAYERLVDTLLNSPRYGERWASTWLDLARYADSKGYERDARRFAWRYRDWLIRTLNADMPYNQFLTEQLAGDLLPKPSVAQLTATQFHRNTPTNDEGGTDNEEFRVAAVLDRVNTTWEAFMGTTFSCVQCHSHPYDPFLHEEYYQFLAFFNNSRDADTFDDYPLIRWYSPADSLRLDTVEQWLTQNALPEEADRMMNLVRVWQPMWYSIECNQLNNCALLDTKFLGMSHVSSARLPNVTLDGLNRLIFRYINFEKNSKITFRLDSLNGPVLATTVLKDVSPKGWQFQKIDLPTQHGRHDIFIYYENTALAKKPDAFGMQFDWFAFTTQFPGKGHPGQVAMEQKWFELFTGPCETSPCMWENPSDYHRPTHVFERGNWMVPATSVQPGTPQYLLPFPSDAPRNRLGLAQWLTNPEHPLTARVMVNRLWEQLFGLGLVETVEDFGSQGMEPSHPELLDYLAWHFMHDNQWSIKKTLRDMVLSATYRQSSVVSAELEAQDPRNRLLARGPRVRLSAEQIRDQTLALSGLISAKMYGKPVMPYQPDGIWNTPWNNDAWQISSGEDRYRRAVYTYWKRSSPYPSMIAFDGAARQVCTARRVRTNTPLQALVTLNDPAHMEAALYFARKLVKICPPVAAEQIKKGYWLATGRDISPEKLQILEELYKKSLQAYQQKPEDGFALLNPLPCEEQTTETAALAVVTNALFNLDEVVTKQ